MPLIDRYLPRFDFRERHSIAIRAAPQTVLAAAEAYRPEDDPLFRRMIALRELPMRAWSRVSGRRADRPAPFGFDDFTLLDRMIGREAVYGLIGRFWASDYGLVAVADGAAYAAFDGAGVAKLALGYEAEARADGTTKLTTETRVFCPDRGVWWRFAPYWYVIRPVSGLIRRRMLSTIRRSVESGVAP